MGWSIGYQPVREPELIDAYLLAVGKALYIASGFEKKCQWVLRIFKLVANYEADPNLDTFEAFAAALKDSLLGPTLLSMATFDGTAVEIGILNAGKDARNFIAHEAAALGHLSNIRARQIDEAITKLTQKLDALIAADNLISKWVYEIEEKEPAPSFIQHQYPAVVKAWILESIGGA